MATVASIVTNLRANTGQFDKALDGAKRKLREVQTYTQQLQQREAAAANARRAAVYQPRIEAEQNRFHQQTTANLQQAIDEMAAYESKAVAVVSSNRKQATSFKELNDSLKSVFGRGSDFKEFLELIMGAGAIGGIGLLTRALADMASGFKKSVVDMATGAKTFNQTVNSVLRSIPILGTGGGAIADFISGLSPGDGSASIAEREAYAQMANDANARYGQMMKQLRYEVSGSTPRGAINNRFRDRISALNEYSGAGGVGGSQYAEARRQIEAARDRELKDLTPHRNVIKELASIKLLDITPDSFLRIRDKLQIGIQAFIGKVANNLAELNAENIKKDAQERFDAAARQAADDAADAADAQQEANKAQYLSEVKGFYERLKERESSGSIFGGATIQGSQADYAARQQAIFGGSIARKDERELAREAVELQKKEIDETKTTNDLLKELLTDLGVVDFS